MRPDTKIYSEFIKRNKVRTVGCSFSYYDSNNLLQVIPLNKDDNGRWYADQDDSAESKKSAIYWYIQNNNNTSNGLISRCISEMKNKVLETLERKKKTYREINAWFENEYDSSVSADKLAEWQRNATEVNAQIQLLLFLLSDDV